jgi:hypothetical protein
VPEKRSAPLPNVAAAGRHRGATALPGSAGYLFERLAAGANHPEAVAIPKAIRTHRGGNVNLFIDDGTGLDEVPEYMCGLGRFTAFADSGSQQPLQVAG